MSTAFVDLVKQRRAVVGIVGLGYVGLPLALRFVEAGFRVIGFDIDAHRVASINAGRSFLNHLPAARIEAARASGRFEASEAFDRIPSVDAILICVPTPLGTHREADMSCVTSTMDGILPHVKRGQLISLESTVFPGGTSEAVRRPLEALGLLAGRDVFVAFSPEREDPGNARFSTRNIPKLVSGCTPACLEAAMALYSAVIEEVVSVPSPEVAEMAKVIENTYRFVNISLVNELKMIADRLGIDIWAAIRAASTKPFGFQPFYPGPGLGGHCIPVDPFYLTWKAREFGMTTRFIELAGEINDGMPEWVAQKLIHALNSRGKSVQGSRVMVLGVAYKKNIDDVRESPSLQLIPRLRSHGAIVSYSDPFVPELGRIHGHDYGLQSVPLTPENIARQDCLLLATDHDGFEYEMLRKHAVLIVDTRGRFPDRPENVISA